MPTFLCDRLTVNMLAAWLWSTAVTDQSTYFKTVCSLQLMSLLSQSAFPCLRSYMTLVWGTYLSLCRIRFRLEQKKYGSDFLFLTWTHKHLFPRTLEGLASSVLFFCFTQSWWWQKVGFVQEKELMKNYCFFEVAYSLLALTDQSSCDRGVGKDEYPKNLCLQKGKGNGNASASL